MVNARLLFVHALSPLHPGTGQGTGVIDLPVAREKSTGIPYLPGSSLKGVLRDACDDKDLRKRVFGPDTDYAHEHAGSIQVSDQRLLLMPVRSLIGTFAWVTSPFILRRLVRDAQAAGITGIPADVPSPGERRMCIVSQEKAPIVHNGQVILEDLDLRAAVTDDARAWAEWVGKQVFPGDAYWQETLTGRFCIVDDDVMSFLLDTATEVVARIRLQEQSKTVERGGLWYEEMLPAETILYGLVAAIPVMAKPDEVFRTLARLIEKPLQIGGKATVGHGLCRLTLVGGMARADT